jgi:crotonobetainyl-CoA:carnitine CoA-transferase CaiB-like acyl-CoA transferase
VSSTRPEPAGAPLAGVRVLDLGIWRPAPFATQLLADLGAVVTKVEPPGGDPMRMFPTLYRSLNHRKRIIELDLKDAAGRAAVLDLAAKVDVAVEGFRPGVADRLGVGVGALRAVNPTIVYCSISGFGQDGPLRAAPGHDLNYQAWTGFLAARAPEIHTSGVPVGDLAGGTYAALAICAAIAGQCRQTSRTSGGASDGAGVAGLAIDVSMADVLLSWAGPEIGGALASSDDPGAGFPAYGTFSCADGHITLGVVSEDPFWVALCTRLGLEDVAALDVRARARDAHQLRNRLDDAIAPRPRDALVRELVEAGVPVAPVLDAREAMHAEAFAHRPVVRDGVDGQPGLPLRFT